MQEATDTNKRALAEKFKEGTSKFTGMIDDHFSGLTRIFERAYFALTDTEKEKFANFFQDAVKETVVKKSSNEDEKTLKSVTGVVVTSRESVQGIVVSRSRFFTSRTATPVTGTVSDDDFFAALSGVSVPQHEVQGEPVSDGKNKCVA